MKTFTAMLHAGDPDEGGFWATCLEVPGANGQGATREECLESLAEGVKLILEVRREEATREAPVLEECALAVA
jgi:predicted RNase H-like HicB family nuclease